jgi:hypothetical protein
VKDGHQILVIRLQVSMGHLIPVMRVHLPEPDHDVMDPAPVLYLIRIHGHLGDTVLSAFPAMTSRRDGAHTVLTGLLDQSALYGVLAQVEALGLELLEVRQLKSACESPEAGRGSRHGDW